MRGVIDRHARARIASSSKLLSKLDRRQEGDRSCSAPRWRNWQTRKVEGLVPFGACWFDSSPGHVCSGGRSPELPAYTDLDSGFGSNLQWWGYGARKFLIDNCLLTVESNAGGEEEIREDIRQARRKDKPESAVFEFGRPGG